MSRRPRQVRPPFRAAVVLLAGLFGCGGLETMCTDELSLAIDPQSVTLRRGETFTPRVDAKTCGGAKDVEIDWRWGAVDTLVVKVDSMSGQTEAVRSGSTTLVGWERGQAKEFGLVRIPVQVL